MATDDEGGKGSASGSAHARTANDGRGASNTPLVVVSLFFLVGFYNVVLSFAVRIFLFRYFFSITLFIFMCLT